MQRRGRAGGRRRRCGGEAQTVRRLSVVCRARHPSVLRFCKDLTWALQAHHLHLVAAMARLFLWSFHPFYPPEDERKKKLRKGPKSVLDHR